MDDISALGEQVLKMAQRHGWVIENGNDNPQGFVVKGPAWKATREGEKPLFAWRREGLAEPLAVWLLGKRTLYMEGE